MLAIPLFLCSTLFVETRKTGGVTLFSIFKWLFLAATLFVLLCVALMVWQFWIPHKIASLELPLDHRIRLTIDYDYDIVHSVYCELQGPSPSHDADLIAFIGAGQSIPSFSVHQSTNRQMFWLTADTMPHVILYMVDFSSSERWTHFDDDQSAKGQKLLKAVHETDPSCQLYNSKWIGRER